MVVPICPASNWTQSTPACFMATASSMPIGPAPMMAALWCSVFKSRNPRGNCDWRMIACSVPMRSGREAHGDRRVVGALLHYDVRAPTANFAKAVPRQDGADVRAGEDRSEEHTSEL